MELIELERDWAFGESEVRGVSWRRQYRDLVLHLHGVGDLKRYAGGRRTFKHEVNGELTFVSCARACFDRSLLHVDSELEEWGTAAWTIVAIWVEKTLWEDREDLAGKGLKRYNVGLDDRWPLGKGSNVWLRAICRDLTFKVLGPATDIETPLRP